MSKDQQKIKPLIKLLFVGHFLMWRLEDPKISVLFMLLFIFFYYVPRPLMAIDQKLHETLHHVGVALFKCLLTVVYFFVFVPLSLIQKKKKLSAHSSFIERNESITPQHFNKQW